MFLKPLLSVILSIKISEFDIFCLNHILIFGCKLNKWYFKFENIFIQLNQRKEKFLVIFDEKYIYIEFIWENNTVSNN